MSDCEGNDSDKELQIAFQKGLLNNLVVSTEEYAPKKTNNKTGLEEALNNFKRFLPWIETLDISCEPAPLPSCANVESAEDDIKMENKFYRQAQAAVKIGLEKIKLLKIPTKRPDDYYAEMVKTDVHMKKVKENLLKLRAVQEKVEEARKVRESRKLNKMADKQKKAKTKKENLDYKKQLKKMKKKVKLGKKEDYEDDDDSGKNKKRKSNFKGAGPDAKKPRADATKPNAKNANNHKPGKKRQWKNEKFGFGGKKKGSKKNTKGSLDDF